MRPALAALALVFATQAFAAGEIYKWTDEKGVVHYTETPPPDRDFEKKNVRVPPPADGVGTEVDKPAAEPARGSDEANCANARRNYEIYEKNANLGVDRDGDGKLEPVSAEDRGKELARYQSLMAIYCKAEAAPAESDAG